MERPRIDVRLRPKVVSGPLFLIEKHVMNDFIDHLFLLMRLIDFSAIWQFFLFWRDPENEIFGGYIYFGYYEYGMYINVS